MIVLLLSSLPDSWETLVVPVRNATTNEKVTMSQVTNILFSEKKRRKSAGPDTGQAFVTENRGRRKSNSKQPGG